MTGNTLGWVIVAFVLYLLMMIAIGAFYAKGNNNWLNSDKELIYLSTVS